MDKLTFIAAVIGSLAWPVAVAVAAFALRAPFQQLLGYMTRLKYGDLELSFDRNLQRLELKAAAAAPKGAQPPRPGPAISPALAQLAEKSPRAAIIEGWIQVSSAAVAALKARGAGAPTGTHVAPSAVERTLKDSGLLNDAELAILRQLRNMRNAAVHGMAFSVDSGTALQYLSSAIRLASLLEERGKAA